MTEETVNVAKAEYLAACGQYGGNSRRAIGQPQKLFAKRLKVTYNLMCVPFPSLRLSEPGGFIRLFVDLGPQMADLLKRLQEQNVAVDYIENILAAFRDEKQVVVPEAAGNPIASDHQPLRESIPSQPLAEPLTNRELDVLELLVQRLQNKEIAEKLFVSPETVKGHLKNIYQKLNVGKRREAVEEAKKIGIL